MVFVVCLYDWDYRCDRDYIMDIIAVYDTLEKAVEYSSSYKLERLNYDIEIVEFDSNQKKCTYNKYGIKIITE